MAAVSPVKRSRSRAQAHPYLRHPLSRHSHLSSLPQDQHAQQAQKIYEIVKPQTVASPEPRLNPSANEAWFREWRGRAVRKVGRAGWICDNIELERQESEHYLLRLSKFRVLQEQIDELNELTNKKLWAVSVFLDVCLKVLLKDLVPFPYPIFRLLRSLSHSQLKILDIGTGTGAAEVIGLDSAPIQQEMAPINCDFDICPDGSLPYSTNSFSLIHIRFPSLTSFRPSTSSSSPATLSSLLSLLRPEGILLIFDWAGPPERKMGEVTRGARAWWDAFRRGIRRAGMGWDLDEFERRAEDLMGGCEVGSMALRMPIGRYKGKYAQLGGVNYINTQIFLESAKYVIMEYGGYSNAEVDVLSEAFLRDVEEQEMWMPYRAVWLQKAFEDGQ
ncbi:uncharacterized protein L203_101309 [Cryptococcus depauperatus CBS 7841]|uniref:Methyltransferase domain-containing protein n=1 Tax=Cryptococcus depauperatus CBS 7841 TaxID=1295531 RepID=A0AAJ8JPR6_9TREE